MYRLVLVATLYALASWALAGTYVAVADEDVPPTHIRGTISAIEGQKATVTAADGTKTILRIAPDAKVLVALRASLADVTPGTYVGVANVGPNGLQDALEVHIYPDAMRGTDEGQKRWDLGRRSRMTTGTAGAKTESYDGQNLVVTFKGGESTIQVRPNTPVVRLMEAKSGDLQKGNAIIVRDGETQPDGSVLVENVVVGRAGLTPPL